MAKPPYFPLYYRDFIHGTQFFTPATLGCYIRLLCVQWEEAVIRPHIYYSITDPLTEEEKEELFLKFSKVNNKKISGFQNPRMEEERSGYIQFNKKQKENGMLGGRPKKNPNDNPNDNPNETQTKASSPSSSSSPSEGKRQNSLSLSAGKKTNKKPPSFPWPEDFKLTTHLKDYASKHGVPDPEEEFENFRLNAKAKSYVYADWSSAWMKWCRDERTSKKPKSEEDVYG